MQETTAHLRLNWPAFEAKCIERGWSKAQERARGLGVTESMISRAKRPDWTVSPRLIAACTRTFGSDAHAELFRVVES